MSGCEWVNDLRELHEKFGDGGGVGNVRSIVREMDEATRKKFWQFRLNFIQEEVDELFMATSADAAVDALTDLIVVAVGTMDAFGVDADRAWREVHIANMKKRVGPNNSRKNKFGFPDLVKPTGWTPPSHIGNEGRVPL